MLALWGERGYGDVSIPKRGTAVSPSFHGCLAFLHWHFPPQSPPSHPLSPSLCSQQQPSPWDCSTILCTSSQPLCLPGDLHPCPGYDLPPSRVCMVASKDCLILIPFRLPQVSCFTLSRKCFSSDSDNCPAVGIRPLFQFPLLPRAGPVLLTLLFFPLVPCPTEFCVVLYIFFC